MEAAPVNEVDEKYPFDPALKGREPDLQGLEKLRAMEDRVLAAKAYEFYLNVTRNSRKQGA